MKIRPKSNKKGFFNIIIICAKIFNEKSNFNTGPRIDARNESYQKNGGNVKVYI